MDEKKKKRYRTYLLRKGTTTGAFFAHKKKVFQLSLRLLTATLGMVVSKRGCRSRMIRLFILVARTSSVDEQKKKRKKESRDARGIHLAERPARAAARSNRNAGEGGEVKAVQKTAQSQLLIRQNTIETAAVIARHYTTI